MKRVIILLMTVLPILATAQTYKLEGMIGGKYPILMELEESDGTFSGKYAYKSTLEKNGSLECSWLYINPEYHHPDSCWTVSDCKHNFVEEWYDIHFTDGKRLTATMKNTMGKVYGVSATVVKSDKRSPSMIAFFKEHLGQTALDFDVLADPSVRQRLEDMMGETNFNYFLRVYQVQVGIEYHNGMYWSSGFMAHQCCDPAALWAYDADNNAFYVWIRKDGQDHWWSETGEVPYKFRLLVSNNF